MLPGALILVGGRQAPPKRACLPEAATGHLIAGTVNPESTGFFKDPAGARRFWPVKVGSMNLTARATPT